MKIIHDQYYCIITSKGITNEVYFITLGHIFLLDYVTPIKNVLIGDRKFFSFKNLHVTALTIISHVW